MNKLLSVMVLGLSLCAGGAFAAAHAGAPMAGASPAKAPTEQQSRMKSCNADPKAKALKGDERKKFMSECLSADAKPAATAQQNKMTTCNADPKAKTLKGDERKAFMKTCLSDGHAMTQQDRMKACNADPKAKAAKGDERKKFMSECLKG